MDDFSFINVPPELIASSRIKKVVSFKALASQRNKKPSEVSSTGSIEAIPTEEVKVPWHKQ